MKNKPVQDSALKCSHIHRSCFFTSVEGGSTAAGLTQLDSRWEIWLLVSGPCLGQSKMAASQSSSPALWHITTNTVNLERTTGTMLPEKEVSSTGCKTSAHGGMHLWICIFVLQASEVFEFVSTTWEPSGWLHKIRGLGKWVPSLTVIWWPG